MTTQYLRVRNWEKFQHYKDRRPPWIKYHVELLDDYELTHMDYSTQLVYDRLLLLAARTDNNIPNDFKHIGRHVNIDAETIRASVEILLGAGLLQGSERKRSASAAIARRKRNADTETEAEKKTEAEAKTENGVADLAAKAAGKDVYEHWRLVRGKKDKRYDRVSPARRQKIKARLAEFTVGELKLALDNVAFDDWSERHKHDDVVTLFKSREAVDRWLSMTGKAVPNDGFDIYNQAS